LVSLSFSDVLLMHTKNSLVSLSFSGIDRTDT